MITKSTGIKIQCIVESLLMYESQVTALDGMLKTCPSEDIPLLKTQLERSRKLAETCGEEFINFLSSITEE